LPVRIYQSSLATDVLRKSQKLKAENELPAANVATMASAENITKWFTARMDTRLSGHPNIRM
jgi:hypothetical protein